MLFETVAEVTGNQLQQRDEVSLAFAIGQRALVGQGQLVDVINQFRQCGHFPLQGEDRLRGQLAYAVLYRFQLTAQYRQRRAQLMRNIGHKGAAHFLIFFQRAGQAVKILCKPAKFVTA
ncbi:hypothetical protein D3C86_1849590 [compost metagenome]